MKPEDFDLFARVIRRKSGLVLSSEKTYLLESRMPPLMRKHNFPTLEDMAHAIRDKRDETLLDEIAETMTINETFFFRDQKPFDQFRQLFLPQFLQTRAEKKRIRIWSAAASSGQEAYSLAMLCAEETTRLQGWQVDILGTDLSSAMIERARHGIYSQFEVQRGLPITFLVKYFQQVGDKWQINERLRQMVQFRTANLLNDCALAGTFDVIYCRNVLFYFDSPTRTRVLNMLAGHLAPDGVLFLGGPESVFGITDKFKPMENERAIYVRTGTSGANNKLPSNVVPLLGKASA